MPDSLIKAKEANQIPNIFIVYHHIIAIVYEVHHIFRLLLIRKSQHFYGIFILPETVFRFLLHVQYSYLETTARLVSSGCPSNELLHHF